MGDEQDREMGSRSAGGEPDREGVPEVIRRAAPVLGLVLPPGAPSDPMNQPREEDYTRPDPTNPRSSWGPGGVELTELRSPVRERPEDLVFRMTGLPQREGESDRRAALVRLLQTGRVGEEAAERDAEETRGMVIGIERGVEWSLVYSLKGMDTGEIDRATETLTRIVHARAEGLATGVEVDRDRARALAESLGRLRAILLGILAMGGDA